MAIDLFREAIAHHKARYESYRGSDYLRLTDNFRGTPRGSIAMRGHIVHGYPSIGRILRLDTGLNQHFQAPFWLEEKVDGYNVRVVCIDEQVLALTRGGRW